MESALSRLILTSRLLPTAMFSILLAGAVAADEPVEKVEEASPPPLCVALAAPAEPGRLQAIQGWTIRYSAADIPAFRETIILMEEDRGRSTRLSNEDRPTAHIVTVDQRRLCLDLGDEEAECLLAVSCADEGVDFVLVGNDARMRATLNAPVNERNSHPADYTDLEPDHDWVSFAQGTVSLVIEASGPVSGHTETRRSINNNCLVQGHPGTRGAFSYAWFGVCRGGSPVDDGTLVILRDNGALERFEINTSRGVYGTSFEDGVYSYGFSSDPIEAKVLCLGTGQIIPDSPASVNAIAITGEMSRFIEIANRDVRNVIRQAFLTKAQDICGNSRDVPVSFEFRGVEATGNNRVFTAFTARFSYSQARGELLIRENPGLLNPFFAEEEFRTNPTPNERAVFHSHLQQRVLEAWQRDVRGQINSRSGPAMNVADALSVDHFGTLMALLEGRTIRIRWQNQEFYDGAFIVADRVRTSDPKNVFFATRSTREWERWRNELDAQLAPTTVEVVCAITPSAARRVGGGPMIEVRGRLVSFSGSRFSLDCSQN